MIDEYSLQCPDDPYIKASLSPDIDINAIIRSFWIKQAELNEESGSYDKAYTCWYNAGWDSNCFDDMDMILDGLEKSADKAGYKPLKNIISLHKKTMTF